MKTPPVAAHLGSIKSFLQRLTRVNSKEPKITLGVDIGSSAVKVVALGARKGPGVRPLLGSQIVPLESGQEIDASKTIKVAVNKLRLPISAANISVSGTWVIMRVIEMPKMAPAEIKQALPFEAQRYLPFNLQEVVIDGIVLGAAETNKVWVLVIACRKELIDRRMDWTKRAGLEVGFIDVDALALTNGFLEHWNGRSDESIYALVNVGAQSTNLSVCHGKIPYLVRDIPWGAEKFFRHTAEHLGLPPDSFNQATKPEIPSSDLAAAMKTVCENLITELQLSFDYFENRFGRPPGELLVSGGLSQSVDFLNALKSHVTQTVSPWSPREELSGQFAIAYGLALRID